MIKTSRFKIIFFGAVMLLSGTTFAASNNASNETNAVFADSLTSLASNMHNTSYQCVYRTRYRCHNVCYYTPYYHCVKKCVPYQVKSCVYH